jgi:hypothetical protein
MYCSVSELSISAFSALHVYGELEREYFRNLKLFTYLSYPYQVVRRAVEKRQYMAQNLCWEPQQRYVTHSLAHQRF